MMSRIEQLLSQRPFTGSTHEQLAETYFGQRPKQRRRVGWMVWLASGVGAVLGMILGGMVMWSAAQPPRTPLVRSVMRFDDAGAMALLGDRFGLWWSRPEDRSQHVSVRLDDRYRLGSEGHALAVHYAVASGHGQVGLWFKLPDMQRSFLGDLAFQVRGDPARAFTTRALLELRGPHQQKQVPIQITKDWGEIRVPLRHSQDGELWEEARLLFDGEIITEQEGAILLGHMQLIRHP